VVESRIASCRAHRDRVDVSSDDDRPQQSSCCDGQHAASGTDIEDAPCPPTLRQIGEREQAAASSAMVACPECEGRFDLDTNVVWPEARAIVRAMNDETANSHGFKAGEASGDPVFTRNWLNAERIRRRRTGRNLDQAAQSGFVGGHTEVDRHVPPSVAAFEGGTDYVFGIEAFAEIGRKPPGSRFVAGKPGDGG
jgi:hypothetical protein